MQEEERRRHFRLPKEARITCQEITYPLGQAPEVAVQMVDVSEGGVGFDAPLPLEVGTLLQVTLILQGWQRHTSEFLKYDETSLSKPLSAVGRVVRRQALGGGQYEIGVEFLDIWEDHWRAMRIYLERESAKLEAQSGPRLVPSAQDTGPPSVHDPGKKGET
jgi:hypothetical protein